MEPDSNYILSDFKSVFCQADSNEAAELNRPQGDTEVDPEDVTRYLTDTEYLSLVLEGTPEPLVCSLADFCLTPTVDLDANGRDLVERLTEQVTEYIAANGLAY